MERRGKEGGREFSMYLRFFIQERREGREITSKFNNRDRMCRRLFPTA